ncbi:MARVEL domain-containing protein 3 isoform X3 [Dipodomys merriami]|uniref:MARVEL domain-containing protein 3 isoform X3 n=1 Tax=Dipodomys merriami TaxID=94247 RepID=UPI0038559FC5
MEDSSGIREPRSRPRERDPDRRPRADRDRHLERPRDRPGDRRGDRDRGRERDPRRERPRDAGHRAAEPAARGAARPSRTRGDPRGPPWPEPWGTPEPPRSEPMSGRYMSSYPRPGPEEVEYYQSEAEGLLECHKCRYLCTGRGFSASFASGGGFGNNYYSPFEGTELEQVRQLDQQYTVLRSPLIYGGVAVSLGLGVLTMSVLLQGAKSLAKLPRKWLLTEATFSLLASVGYCVGIGVYLHVALQINATDTCKTRERLYARKGLTWMNCQLAGTDGAAATFACLLVIMYGASVVLALRSYREQKLYKDSQEQHRNYSDTPEYLWSGTL